MPPSPCCSSACFFALVASTAQALKIVLGGLLFRRALVERDDVVHVGSPLPAAMFTPRRRCQLHGAGALPYRRVVEPFGLRVALCLVVPSVTVGAVLLLAVVMTFAIAAGG